MASPSIIHFFFKNTSITLDHRARLKAFINKIFKTEGKKLKSLNYIFCTDKELLRINREFLNHDFLTDIITFDLSESTNQIEAEIYISVERVRENAILYDTTLKNELLRVILHGVLHLCGFKDKTGKDRGKMRQKEEHYLNLYFKKRFT